MTTPSPAVEKEEPSPVTAAQVAVERLESLQADLAAAVASAKRGDFYKAFFCIDQLSRREFFEIHKAIKTAILESENQ